LLAVWNILVGAPAHVCFWHLADMG
jgi:hypothetical protein